jgi:hypothetical protein
MKTRLENSFSQGQDVATARRCSKARSVLSWISHSALAASWSGCHVAIPTFSLNYTRLQCAAPCIRTEAIGLTFKHMHILTEFSLSGEHLLKASRGPPCAELYHPSTIMSLSKLLSARKYSMLGKHLIYTSLHLRAKSSRECDFVQSRRKNIRLSLPWKFRFKSIIQIKCPCLLNE